MVSDAPEIQDDGSDKLLKWGCTTLVDPTPLYNILDGLSTKKNPRTSHCYMEKMKSLAMSKLFPEIMRLVYG